MYGRRKRRKRCFKCAESERKVAGTEIRGCRRREVFPPSPLPLPVCPLGPLPIQAWRKSRFPLLRSEETVRLPLNSDYLIKMMSDVIMTSTKFFDAFSLVGHSWSLVVTRGQLVVNSWSLVVTRGHSWSFVVTRGHSWSLVCTFRHDLK